MSTFTGVGSTTSVIHLADAATSELRSVCGAGHQQVNWTTVLAVVTCPACARLMGGAQRRRRASAAVRRPATTPPGAVPQDVVG
jgi:hypothetical protein